ncbi:MAG TPA: sulfatase-like hydrolase/transferase [Gemmatimonadaceae bacterium]|nr:sulfatase-like hydrolase/transferase [Gemmatimonadaceae bacterium]
MRTRETITATWIFASVALSSGADAQGTAQQPAGQPNVVLIIMDDLGYGDLGSYGARDVRTPNIDRLARQGVRLTDAYANGQVCSPTRAALISGRYPQRYGIETALPGPTRDTTLGLPVTGTSLPALLKTSGYATGLVGKWHLGTRREFSPHAHGFDEFFGFLGGGHNYYLGFVFDDTTRVPLSSYLTDEITTRALGFIDRHATGPFFLEVAYNAVHWPFQPPDRPPTEAERRTPRLRRQYPGDSVPATRQDYVRMLERADEGVGKILAALEQRGLARNTLVIFTNDNGGEWLSSNAPFFHRKGTLWEGGIRVPLILRWPGVLPAGKTSPQVAATMDLTATILAATGTKAPDSHRPDGVNIPPVLRGDAPVLERRVFWRIDQPNRHQRAVRSGRWKLVTDGGHTFLFDLENDPGERNDLVRRHPDRVASLIRLYTEWEKDVDREGRSR